jgi:hypothetical protein
MTSKGGEMGGFVATSAPCAKGAICHSLDEFSKGRGAGPRVRKLRDAIAAAGSSHEGIADVFDRHLLSHVLSDADRQRAIDYLKRYWLNPKSPTPFFPSVPVARLLAEGVQKALDLSLAGKGVVPINAWWVPDSPEFKVLTLADVKDGVTVSGHVTLLVMTPRPAVRGRSANAIMGDVAEAHVTHRKGRAVRTQRVRDL